jgi:hypothetical protein
MTTPVMAGEGQPSTTLSGACGKAVDGGPSPATTDSASATFAHAAGTALVCPA